MKTLRLYAIERDSVEGWYRVPAQVDGYFKMLVYRGTCTEDVLEQLRRDYIVKWHADTPMVVR